MFIKNFGCGQLWSKLNKFVNSNDQCLFVGNDLLITFYSVHSRHFTKL